MLEKNKPITREQYEKFARSFEAYCRLSEKELAKAQDILREKAMKHKVLEKMKAYRDELAESFDFASGDERIRALAQLPNRQEYVNEKARVNLQMRDGDFLNNDQVAHEAEDALNNEFTEELLRKELAIFNRLKAAGKAAKLSEQRKRIEERKGARRIKRISRYRWTP